MCSKMRLNRATASILGDLSNQPISCLAKSNPLTAREEKQLRLLENRGANSCTIIFESAVFPRFLWDFAVVGVVGRFFFLVRYC